MMDDSINSSSVHNQSLDKFNSHDEFHHFDREQCILDNFKPRDQFKFVIYY